MDFGDLARWGSLAGYDYLVTSCEGFVLRDYLGFTVIGFEVCGLEAFRCPYSGFGCTCNGFGCTCDPFYLT